MQTQVKDTTMNEPTVFEHEDHVCVTLGDHVWYGYVLSHYEGKQQQTIRVSLSGAVERIISADVRNVEHL
jgi:Na+-translocating ferredoxin:NAD+ oxidoreductase RnfC subunit